MTNTPKYWNHAKKFLSKKDKILSKLIAKYKGPFEIILTTRKDIFFIMQKYNWATDKRSRCKCCLF